MAKWTAGMMAGAAIALSTHGADTPSLPSASLPELETELPGARAGATAAMHLFGLHIYDARLWSEAPVRDDGAAQPLAIEVRYARALSGVRIARRSLEEMQRLEPVSTLQAEQWLRAMTQLFPDVQAGDRITGIQWPGQSARFFVNGRHVGELADPAFVRLFFGIWLSPRTSQPGLRAKLIGAQR